MGLRDVVVELYPGEGVGRSLPGGPAQDLPLPAQDELLYIRLTAKHPIEVHLKPSPDLPIGNGSPFSVIHLKRPEDQPIPTGKDLGTEDVQSVGREGTNNLRKTTRTAEGADGHLRVAYYGIWSPLYRQPTVQHRW